MLDRYHSPRPRLALGSAVRGIASAAVDISDGLLADLDHILEASEVGASIDSARLPVSPHLKRLKGDSALDYALRSGDDYELCLTIPAECWRSTPGAIRKGLSVIGTVESRPGLVLDGKPCGADTGFDHFKGRP